MSQSQNHPVTSDQTSESGTTYGYEDDAESLRTYQPGGFHPVHLGDYFGSDGQYRVIHKLGFGGFGTVWLCYDEKEKKMVALKIHSVRASVKNPMELHLAGLDRTTPGANFISLPLDHFHHTGPNGVHRCLVFSLYGPRVSPGLWHHLSEPGPKLKKMCLQASRAMAFLHQNGICHGDFRANNILVKLKNIDALTENAMMKILEKPMKVRNMLPKEQRDVRMPEYLVIPAELEKLNRDGGDRLMDEISIIDFGEAFHMSDPPKFVGIPVEYQPPEGLIEGAQLSVGIGHDLWALGCAIFEIKFQLPIFYMLNGRDEILAEMVYFFGKFPDHLWQKWPGRSDYFKEGGQKLPISITGRRDVDPVRFEDLFAEDMEIWDNPVSKRVYSVTHKEQFLCREMLLKLFKYAPGRRLAAARIAEDVWFKVEDL